MTTMDAIETILKKAESLGACGKTRNVACMDDLAELLFSPQGMEFCSGKGFPTIGDLGMIPSDELERNGVYFNSGVVTAVNRKRLAAIGGTVLNAVYDGDAESYTVFLLHGGKAVISASGYAVVSIHGEGEVSVNRGAYAKVFIDKKIKEV